MIDFDNLNTIPNSILSLIIEKKELIKEELLLESEMHITGNKWKGSHVSKNNYTECFHKIKGLIQKEKILGFHCTKQTNPNELHKTGLNQFNHIDYEIWLKKFLRNKISDKRTIKEIEKCFISYKEASEYDHRENKLWFVINKSLIYESGCKYFFKYYGGETIRRIMYSFKDVVFPILIQTGIPTVVAFEFKFIELDEYHQDNLVKTFIESKTLDNSYKYYTKMRAEGFIKRNIKPKEIINIFYNNDVEELKNAVVNKIYTQ